MIFNRTKFGRYGISWIFIYILVVFIMNTFSIYISSLSIQVYLQVGKRKIEDPQMLKKHHDHTRSTQLKKIISKAFWNWNNKYVQTRSFTIQHRRNSRGNNPIGAKWYTPSWGLLFKLLRWPSTAQKMKFSITDLFGKCDQIRRKLWIRSHLLKKSVMENFILCAMIFNAFCTNLPIHFNVFPFVPVNDGEYWKTLK